MPPLLLGLPGDNSFRNYEEANRAFWRQTVIPMVARLQKSFHAWLQPAYAAFRFDYNIDRIDALARERQPEWSRIRAASFLTQDEQREAVGYGPAPKPAPGPTELRYSPNQPRVPAGSAQGGQWTSGGGGGGGGGGDAGLSGAVSLLDAAAGAADALGGADSGPKVILATDDRNAPTDYSIDVLDQDDSGAHIYDLHINESDNDLVQRVINSRYNVGPYVATRRAGSFSSLDAAQKLINSTIMANKPIIEQVILGAFGEEGKRIEKIFNSITAKRHMRPVLEGIHKFDLRTALR